jgi:hypothetical protein
MNYMLPLPPLADGGWLIGLVAVFLIFGGGGFIMEIIKNINQTRLEMAQLRAGQQSTAGLGNELAAMRDELTTLRQQVSELRDTSTQYDLSFDHALQRIERRVEQVEQQQRIKA